MRLLRGSVGHIVIDNRRPLMTCLRLTWNRVFETQKVIGVMKKLWRGNAFRITVNMWGEPWITGGCPSPTRVMWSFDALTAVIIDLLLHKQPRWLESPWHSGGDFLTVVVFGASFKRTGATISLQTENYYGGHTENFRIDKEQTISY